MQCGEEGEEGADVESLLDCRALVCEGDAGCPAPAGAEPFVCQRGLCVRVERPIEPADSVLLCLGGTGAGRGDAAQLERFTMAQNCGAPCVVPSACRQP